MRLDCGLKNRGCINQLIGQLPKPIRLVFFSYFFEVNAYRVSKKEKKNAKKPQVEIKIR